MRIKCGDHWHQASPTALAIIIEAFQDGDLTFTKSSMPRCVRFAFTAERLTRFKRLYKGNDIIFDWKDLRGRPRGSTIRSVPDREPPTLPARA